jgi:ABC-2 type transport system permease protein
MSPVFGPMTMYVRTLVSDPPPLQIAISIVVSIATIALFLWVTAKIFRVGILSYGKRPTIPELWRWMKVA